MLKTVNIHEAKTHLSRLIDGAVNGDAFVIAKAGKPLVKVEALKPSDSNGPRRLGFLAGQFEIPDDFDSMGQPDIDAPFGPDN